MEEFPSLLSPEEPPTYTATEGTSPIIIAGPHNGNLVPQSLYDKQTKPLGLNRACFQRKSPFKRHEACDWGVQRLFEELQRLDKKHKKHHSYISGNYSRLVADLARAGEDCITRRSVENRNNIPGNINISKDEKKARIKQFHRPFHKHQKELIAQTRKKHGYAIFLDMHSFTSSWKNQQRDTHIGTLASSDSFVEQYVADHMREMCGDHNLNFSRDYPYNLKSLPKKRRLISQKIEKNGVWYVGIEVRNDLLRDVPGAKTIAKIILELTTRLEEYEDKSVFEKSVEKI